jgi:hypothetical protein
MAKFMCIAVLVCLAAGVFANVSSILFSSPLLCSYTFYTNVCYFKFQEGGAAKFFTYSGVSQVK